VSGAQDWWSGFERDPRLAANRGLRAADRDRDLVRQLLAEAFADGRLDRAEFDERSDRLDASRTLGELPDLVADLVPVDAPRRPAQGLMRAEDLRAKAVEEWRSDRREAAFGLVAVSTITTVIWAVTMLGDFFWPAFVMAAATLNLLRIQVMREQHIAEEQKRLEKKAADRQRRLQKRRTKELEDGQEDEEP
jgi:hypothetical protein